MQVIEQRPLRLVAVTGGGSGIGRAVCRGLAASGLEVVALGRNAAALDETAGGDARIRANPLDVTDAAACAAAFGEIEAAHGPVDVLIAAAGIYPRVHFLDQSAASFQDTMLTNICGVANAVRAVLPGMLARNLGRIVVLGSLADNAPIPTAVAYSASKGALHAFVKGIASEIDPLRTPDVLINELLPGATRTAMSDFGQDPEEVVKFVTAQLEFPAGGPTGRCWRGFDEVRLGESWKRALLRVVLRRS